MKCRRCGSESHCKDGIVKNRQRFKCKEWNYRYTVEKKSDVKSEETKRLAFAKIKNSTIFCLHFQQQKLFHFQITHTFPLFPIVHH